jgi:hypothetical protein
MKCLSYLKIAVFAFNFLPLSVGAMEQEIEESLNSGVPPLRALCIQEIDRQTRTNSIFVINERDKLKEKLRSRDSQYEITEEEIDKFVEFYYFSSEISEDPPLFYLKNGNKDIYILGSPHTIPMFKCLALPSLSEIRRISTLRPTLYVEHEITNERAFPLLANPKNHIDPISLKHSMDLLSKAGGGKISPLRSEFLKHTAGHFFFTSMSEISDVALTEVSRAKTWLGAVLLGVHANILSFQRFGGVECELMQQPCWNNYWKEVRFLETNDEVLKIQEKFEKEDNQHNLAWAKKSITTIINFISCNEDKLEEITTNAWKQLMGIYSYNIIGFSAEGYVTKSALARNEGWAGSLSNVINDERDSSPLFLVIGNDHLVGYREMRSFLSLLMANSSFNPSLSRFSNEQKGWIPVDEF